MLPAYAGMIPKFGKFLSSVGGAPRVCGDDPLSNSARTAQTECSPRMRG